MKNKLFILLGLFFVITLQAQKELSKDYSYTVSEPYQVYDAAKKFYFSKNGEMLTVKPWKKYLIIQKFNEISLKQISLKEYNDLPKNYVVEGMEEIQEKFYFFYSTWSGKKTKQERLYYREINFEKGAFIGDAKQIIGVSGKLAGTMAISNSANMFTFGANETVDKFSIQKSKDESRILIKYRKKPKVKNDKKSYDIIGLSIFNSTLNKQWEREYTMPYTERRMDALDYEINSNGNVYLVSRVFHDDSNKDKKGNNFNYHIELFNFLESNATILKTKLELGDHFINGIKLVETDDKNMMCLGFYNNLISNVNKANNKITKRGNADGIFTFKLTNDAKVTDKHKYEIPIDILTQYIGKGAKNRAKNRDKKDKAEFVDLQLKDIILNPDGSLIMVGEQSYAVEHRSSGGGYGGGSVYYVYYYKDMLITKIDSEGKLSWMKKLPKRQVGKPKTGQIYDTSKMYQGGMSYSYFSTKGNHYLVFLDNVKNIDLPITKIPAKHDDGKGGYLTAYKINDTTGHISKGSILDTRNVKDKLAVYQFSNNRLVKIAEDEFIVEVYKKKKEDVLIKIKIEG